MLKLIKKAQRVQKSSKFHIIIIIFRDQKPADPPPATAARSIYHREDACMDAALRVLAENPFSDEAAFAALALIAKSSQEQDFVSKRAQVFETLGGAKFFKRMLTTPGMEAIALNVLPPFCLDHACAEAVRVQCGKEVVSACKLAVAHGAENGLSDACECLVGLHNLSGTCSFLLECSKMPNLTKEQKQKVFNAFEATCDPLVDESDGSDIMNLMATDLDALVCLARGLAGRIDEDDTILTRTLSDKCAIGLSRILRDKNALNKDANRRAALLSLASSLVRGDPRVLERHLELCLILSVLCSVEIRVGLQMLADQERNLSALYSSAVCLDACASTVACAHVWQDEEMLEKVLSTLTGVCESIFQYFAGLSVDPNANQGKNALHEILVSFATSMLIAFYADDPIGLSGLREASQRLGLPRALPSILATLDIHSLRLLLPVLIEIPPAQWCPRLCEHNGAPLRHFIQSGLGAEEQVATLVYFCVILVMVSVEAPQSERYLDQSALVTLRSRLELEYAKQKKEEVSADCVEGCLLLVDALLKPEGVSSRARSFLDRMDALFKSQRDVDGELDALYIGDFLHLLTNLHYKHLTRILTLVRQECL